MSVQQTLKICKQLTIPTTYLGASLAKSVGQWKIQSGQLNRLSLLVTTTYF
ncbi:MAG: hypothetical protein LRZ84_12415 [Desertifilum sp.]|nr:hypothetical protein [Desertifilum sp.]